MFLLVRWSADIPSYGQLSWLARPDWINGIFHQPHESRKREASLVLMLSNAALNIIPASAFQFAQACFIHCVVQRPHSPFFWRICADVETALAVGNVFAMFIVSYLVIPILHSHRKQAFSCSGPLQPTYLWAVTVFFLHNLRNRGYLPDKCACEGSCVFLTVAFFVAVVNRKNYAREQRGVYWNLPVLRKLRGGLRLKHIGGVNTYQCLLKSAKAAWSGLELLSVPLGKCYCFCSVVAGPHLAKSIYSCIAAVAIRLAAWQYTKLRVWRNLFSFETWLGLGISMIQNFLLSSLFFLFYIVCT